MGNMFNIRKGYLAYPPLRHDMMNAYDFMMNRVFSKIVMNGSTGVWAEPFDKDKFQVCVYSSMEELNEAIGPEAVEHINKVLGGVK